MIGSMVRLVHAWARYPRAVEELSQLTDRELADMGLTRSDIHRVAWDHAQG
jgi:uncharacterized protein YjiS (DUF1127 family)